MLSRWESGLCGVRVDAGRQGLCFGSFLPLAPESVDVVLEGVTRESAPAGREFSRRYLRAKAGLAARQSRLRA